MDTKQNDLLGYVVSYKETQTVNDSLGKTIRVKSVSNFMETIPEEIKSKRDFSAEPVFSGDLNLLHIDVNDFVRFYEIEIKKELNIPDDVIIKRLEHMRKNVDASMTEKEFKAFACFTECEASALLSHRLKWFSQEEREQAILKTIGKETNLENTVMLYFITSEFYKALSEIYDSETNYLFL